jgi:hypothetical protein
VLEIAMVVWTDELLLNDNENFGIVDKDIKEDKGNKENPIPVEDNEEASTEVRLNDKCVDEINADDTEINSE